jgi:2'-5' RNA ligase
MSAPSTEQILTYWLIPAEPIRSHFASINSDLAMRFDAPIFQPHTTIYVTKSKNEDAEIVLKRALANCKPYRLSIGGIDCSDEFTKTVFVQFAPDDALTRLSRNLRRASALQNKYPLNPHLTLIYKTMSRETKEKIARSLSLPFQEVLFDSAKAVISPARIKSRKDVEAWRVMATHQLTE